MLESSVRPSDVLEFLQNNMTEDEALSVTVHVLATMKYHVNGEHLASLYADYLKHKRGACVVGREDEIDALFECLQHNKGLCAYKSRFNLPY